MTKTKKLNKIIPAVLLSGAMLMPVSQLTSPIIANALNSSYSNNDNDNDNSKVDLSLLQFKTETNTDTDTNNKNLLDENYTYGDNNIVITSGTSISFDLGKKYSELNVDLGTHRNNICPLNFKFFVDGKLKKDITVNVGTNVDSQRVDIDLKDASTLKIQVSNGNGYSNNLSFRGELKNPRLTTLK